MKVNIKAPKPHNYMENSITVQARGMAKHLKLIGEALIPISPWKKRRLILEGDDWF